MSHVLEPSPPEHAAPVIPPRARTVVYIGCLAVNVLTILGFGLAVVFELLSPERAGMAGTVILAAINLVSNSLSIGYRPTRHTPGALPQ